MVLCAAATLELGRLEAAQALEAWLQRVLARQEPEVRIGSAIAFLRGERGRVRAARRRQGSD